MHLATRIDKISSGRYAVYCTEGNAEAYIGLLLGGNRTWIGEDRLGRSTRKQKTRQAALRALLIQLYQNPIDGIPRPRPRLETWFELSENKSLWEETFGNEALEAYAKNHFREWLDETYPEHSTQPVDDLDELAYIAQTARRYLGWRPQDMPQYLASGERYGRWALPVVDGILTPEFWETRLANAA